MSALYSAVDTERRARELTWVELAAQVNQPFQHTTSIPINVATIREMPKKSSVTSAVVLQLLRWLGRTPESFLSGHEYVPKENERLPNPGPSRILRFDTRAMYEALDRERRLRGMTWRQVAHELPGFTPSMLTNLAAGPLIGFPRVMRITQWLRLPAAAFVRGHDR